MNNQRVLQAIVTPQTAQARDQKSTRLALFKEDGTAIDLTPATPKTGATLVLTGYAPVSAAAVAATDSANQAIAKLEARIVALEA